MITTIRTQVSNDRFVNSYVTQAIQVIGGSLFFALCSQIKIALPFSIVLITLQTLCVMLLSSVFGARKSALMILAYLAQVMMGWPVLSGGLSNPFVLVGPKAGYYFGFVVQAYAMGWMLEKMKGFSLSKTMVAGLVSCAIQLSMGVCWLSLFVGLKSAMLMGLYPFIPVEILKVMAVATILKKTRKS